MPHAHHHGPHPHHPPGGPGPARWIFSAERRARLGEVASILTRFGTELADGGKIELRDDLTVSPPDPCNTVVRFERSPIGELILKIELKWSDGEEAVSEDSLDVLLAPESAAPAADSEARS